MFVTTLKERTKIGQSFNLMPSAFIIFALKPQIGPGTGHRRSKYEQASYALTIFPRFKASAKN